MGSRQSTPSEKINKIVQDGFNENYKVRPIKGIKKSTTMMPKGTKAMNGKTQVKGKK